MEKDDFYKGNLNTQRIKAYNKLKEKFNISRSTVGIIFCAGIDFAMEEQEKKAEQEARAVFEAARETTFYNPDDPCSMQIPRYEDFEQWKEASAIKKATEIKQP